MSEVAALITRAQAYAKRSGLKESTVSRKLLGNGKRLAELRAGKSLRVDTLVRASALLDELDVAAWPREAHSGLMGEGREPS
jgi:hypothetical protein